MKDTVKDNHYSRKLSEIIRNGEMELNGKDAYSTKEPSAYFQENKYNGRNKYGKILTINFIFERNIYVHCFEHAKKLPSL